MRDGLLEGLADGLGVLGVDEADLVDADGLAQADDIEGLALGDVQRRDAGGLLGERDAIAGVALRAGHGGRAVVQDA